MYNFLNYTWVHVLSYFPPSLYYQSYSISGTCYRVRVLFLSFHVFMSLILPQHSGRFYEELPNTADYVSYRLACNKEDYPEPYSPPINPPLSFLPQHPYQPQPAPASSSSSTGTSKNTFSPPSHTTAIFKYPSVQGLSSPPPGVAAYTFPKEQYVWTLEQTRASPVRRLLCDPWLSGSVSALSVDCSGGQRAMQLLFLFLCFIGDYCQLNG